MREARLQNPTGHLKKDFPYSESWIPVICCISHFLYNAHGLIKQAGFTACQTGTVADLRQILARRAERNHIHGRYFAAVYLRDIAQMQHIREMPPGDRYRRSGDLTGPRGDNPAAGRGEGEHADTVKQAAEFKCGHGQTSCDYAPARRPCCSTLGISHGYGKGSHSARPGLNSLRNRGRCDNT